MKEEKLGSGVWGPRGLAPSLPHHPGLWASIRTRWEYQASGSSICRAPSKDHCADWGSLLTGAIATIYQTLLYAWSCAKGFLCKISFYQNDLSGRLDVMDEESVALKTSGNLLKVT